MSNAVWFSDWATIGRTIAVGTAAYVALVALLRVSGNRTLSKMNAFDFVVTVALGSTLATVLLSRDVALAEGVVALALLIGLQFAITWLSVRSDRVRRMVKAEPVLVAHRGAVLADASRRARVTRAEVDAAVRAAGLASLADVEAVVLETEGSLSVIEARDGDPTAARDVEAID